MHFTVLGSGTIRSDYRRNPSGYLLSLAGDLALMDCGPGILGQLKRQRINPLAINTIFISHFHLDHCSDVFPLMMNRALMDDTANAQLTIYGPEGLKAWYNHIAATQGSWLEKAKPTITVIDDSAIDWNGITVECRPNYHTSNSISYLFSGEAKLFYSSDMEYQESLIGFARDSDWAIMECALPDNLKRSGHMTPSSVGRFAREAKIKNLLLTHLYPENDRPVLKEEVARFFKGKIIIAEDFYRFRVG